LQGGSIFSHAVLLRSKGTFHSIKMLVESQYYFEALTVTRFLLEQLAWAFAICDLSLEDLPKTSSTSSIGQLKKLYPLAGYLYGHLSNWAHVHPDVSLNFFNYSFKAPSSLKIHLKGNQNLLWLIPSYLMILDDCYGTVVEYVHVHNFKSFRYIVPDKQNSRLSLADTGISNRLEKLGIALKSGKSKIFYTKSHIFYSIK
jgi:hypothetical protein